MPPREQAEGQARASVESDSGLHHCLVWRRCSDADVVNDQRKKANSTIRSDRLLESILNLWQAIHDGICGSKDPYRIVAQHAM